MTDDYCDYIRPASLAAAVPLDGRTADDAFLLAGLASAALWWRLRQRDLDVILGQQTPLSRLPKIEHRTAVIDDLLGQHARLVAGAALDPRRLTVRLSADLKLDELVGELFGSGSCGPGTGPPGGRSAIEELASYLRMIIPAAGHAASVGNFIDMPTLLGVADTTLRKYHQRSTAKASLTNANDSLTFITSHQSPEIWFLAARSSVAELRGELRAATNLSRAVVLARRISRIMYLFADMIHAPQTMTAADYRLFRDELCRGSGAESVQFRAWELELGVRDPRYIARLAEYGLLTDELNRVLAQPSINDELMALLLREHVISPGQAADVTAAELAHAIGGGLSPAAPECLAELIDAILDIENSWNRWRINHIDMVGHMIGSQSSGLGIAGRPTTVIKDGMPFLLDTLRWARMFPAVESNRNYQR